MLLAKENIQHVNSITHEGKVVVVATDAGGSLWYTVKQDGFEDSYLTLPADQRTGWEVWKALELPNEESGDESVFAKERAELTYQNNPDTYLLRSRYDTGNQSAVAPVQLVSGLGHLYVFRQSKLGATEVQPNTLLVDRFVLDGLTNTLTPKLEVRFKRSKQKHKPSENQRRGSDGNLANIDSLDFTDIAGTPFYEPTIELSLINNLVNGWFSVVLLPTSEQDKYRWHIFAYNSATQKVEITTLRASEEGLFEVKDYTILDPEPRSISGIINQTLSLENLTVAKGLIATRYDVQRETKTANGEMQLLRDSVRVMLVVGTSAGNVAAISFAVAADGTLSQIASEGQSTLLRNTPRQVLLPLNTLDEIKAIGQSSPAPQGTITRLTRGENDEVVLTSKLATGLDETEITQIKIAGGKDCNCLYSSVTIVDENTFEIASDNTNGKAVCGNWEVVPEEETGLVYNGIVTSYEITHAGNLRVTAFNHGLDNGDAVQVVNTKAYNGTYTVTKIDEKTFSLDGVKWQPGTAISAKLQTHKRRGIIFDGVDDYVELSPSSIPTGSEITITFWAKGGNSLPKTNSILEAKGANGQRILNIHLPWPDQKVYFDCGNDRIEKTASPQEYKGEWVHWAFTKNAVTGEMTIYRNGDSWHRATGKTTSLPTTVQCYLGKSVTIASQCYEGSIAELCIWNKVRTVEDIRNSMYLQLTGREVSLLGYWRLDAIFESENERKVIDFAVDGHDGVVNGGAYVSAITLERNLDKTTPAIKYENEELVAVAERATYTEEFEFKTDVAPSNNIFAFTCKGKKSRNAQEWIAITPEPTAINPIGTTGWYKAISRFTVPEGVSMVRSFGIGDIDIECSWKTLDIRKHQIQLVSNSITEETYPANLSNLTILGDNQLQLQESLKQLDSLERREIVLLKEKKRLEADIATLGLAAGERKQTSINDQTQKILKKRQDRNIINSALISLTTTLQAEEQNPLNYWCKLVCRRNEGATCSVNIGSGRYSGELNYAIPEQPDVHFKFIATNNGYYRLETRNPNGRLLSGINSCNQVYCVVDNNSSPSYYEWKPERIATSEYYLIRNRQTNEVLNQGNGRRTRDCENIIVNSWTEILNGPSNQQQWKIIKAGESTNNKIQEARSARDAKQSELNQANTDLEQLERDLALLQASDPQASTRELQQKLNDVISQLNTLQSQLNISNTELIRSVTTRQQTPQKMHTLQPVTGDLETRGALLGFVRPASRISAIETCEGNVQLSYFDDQGRMRQTNFDATYDSKNSAGEQWIPDSLRTCLNFDKPSSVVTLNTPIALGEEWTIEAWFAYPLPETMEWNTLTRGQDGGHHIIVKREANDEWLGIFSEAGFIKSEYNLKNLSPGWHHLTAVAQGSDQAAKTIFYVDGSKVGEVKGKVSRNVYTIGNFHGGGQSFGKLAEVRIWGVALRAEEIVVNSKTLLTGNEPGLLTYYPFNEATGTTVKDKTGASSDGTIVGASWWGCAAPIGSLGHQVMQFDGVDDYVEIADAEAINFSSNQDFTVEAWVKANPTQQDVRLVDNSVIEKWSGSQGYPYVIRYNNGNGKISAGRWNGTTGSSLASQVSINDGAFHHVAFVKQGSQLTLYIDGDYSIKGGTTQDTTTGNTQNTSPLYLGCRGKVSNFFKGQISEVRIWKVARTQSEIKAKMNQRLTGKEAQLVAYYPLNEIQLSGSTRIVLDIANIRHGTVTQAILVPDHNLPLHSDALVCSEYSTVSQDRTAMMRRFFAAPTLQGVELLPDKRVEELELKWIGNGQFAPTLLGYIEGSPPIPSENLTLEENYNGATSVELALSEDVAFKWTRSENTGLGLSIDFFVGTDVEQSLTMEAFGVGTEIKSTGIRAGGKGNLSSKYESQRATSITSSSSLKMANTLKLCGTQEQIPNFSHLGKRFIPKNIGYALVVSALADVFVTRLERTKKMIGYQVLPVENIPPDVNTITFLINPAYTISGSLDGMTGSSATSQRFFKHVPEMRAKYGSLYPASYYRLQEAYALKQKIEEQDKARESYFCQFNSSLVDEASLERETDTGNAPGEISVSRAEAEPDANLSEEQKKAKQGEVQKKLVKQAETAKNQQSAAVTKKQTEIDKLIKDPNLNANATASFAKWQKKMEDIQIRAGKRNIVNTYVWDADGGLRIEAQSFANTAEHSIGASFSLDGAIGWEQKFSLAGGAQELTAQEIVSLTQTMSKTETRSKGIQLNVDLSGVESRGITDYNDYPILPSEKVGRYRFMSFYLEGNTNHFHDFFSYVVDPEWLASNSEEARALRQARGKANKTWRVLHRVTYVERPALMGFGRDMRQLPTANSANELSQLQGKVDKLEQQNAEMQRKLDNILKKLES